MEILENLVAEFYGSVLFRKNVSNSVFRYQTRLAYFVAFNSPLLRQKFSVLVALVGVCPT